MQEVYEVMTALVTLQHVVVVVVLLTLAE